MRLSDHKIAQFSATLGLVVVGMWTVVALDVGSSVCLSSSLLEVQDKLDSMPAKAEPFADHLVKNDEAEDSVFPLTLWDYQEVTSER